MAYDVIGQSGNTTAYVMEFQIDTTAEIADLPKSPKCAVGSYCLCLENSSVWKLGHDNEWHEI